MRLTAGAFTLAVVLAWNASAWADEPPAPGKKSGLRSGRVVSEDELRKEPLGKPSGNLHVYNINLREELKINIYNGDGTYNVEGIQSVSHLMRCRRTDEERPMEPRLFKVLSTVYDYFGGKRIEVVSGFRYQRKTTSFHFKGTAADIRIEGVAAKKLRAFVESLDTGGMGIGIYPRTGFVHVDVRPPPSYRWVDWSGGDARAVGKQPPRNFKKRKKLES